MANNRIYYAIQQVGLGTSGLVALHGIQSVGLTTNFNLAQIYEMGQLSLYQNYENIPDIEVTLNKVLDGYPLIYTVATESGTAVSNNLTATSPDLAGRANTRTDLALTIFPEQRVSATGIPLATVTCNGMYVSSVSYTFPNDGNFTEDVTLVGNDKVWTASGSSGQFPTNNDAPTAVQGVNRRQHLTMANCRFPAQIPGIGSDGKNTLNTTAASGFNVHFQNIKVSCNMGRESIFELGTKMPYYRYINFPVQVSCDFDVMSVSGEWIQASASGYYTNFSSRTAANSSTGACDKRFNLINETIYLETCEGTKIDLGSRNKLTSVNYTGGDTGGGNVTMTYSYQNFNDFTVAHSSGLYYASVSAPTVTISE